MSWLDRLVEGVFGGLISRRVEQAVKVIDDEYWRQVGGGGVGLDQLWQEKKADLDEALEAWRTNPLARRIVSLCSDYVVGPGLVVDSGVKRAAEWAKEFWERNGMASRVRQWCDELTRSGEIFVIMRVDSVSGAVYVRNVPAVQVDEIETDPQDLERELRYHQVVPGQIEGRWWLGKWSIGSDEIMLHYAVNRPVGCKRGEGDLGPILSWLKRYKDWLENRVRLNRYKTAFLWDVTVTSRPGRGDVVRQKRYKYKSAPSPGSVIVHDDNEKWEAVSPRLEAWDAKEDGKALRLAIAAGAGIPLHFLAEGESATKATAAEMGDPTFRFYGRRQREICEMVADLLGEGMTRARQAGRPGLPIEGEWDVRAPDVTRGDNLQMAQAGLLAARMADTLARWGIVDQESFVELVMRYGGEMVAAELVKRRLLDDGAIAPTEVVLKRVGGEGGGRPYGSMEGSGEGE